MPIGGEGLGFHMLTADVGWRFTKDAMDFTADGGRTWQRRTPPGLGVDDQIFVANFSPGVASFMVSGVPAGDGSRLYVTFDHGLHWTSTALPGAGASLGAVAVDFIGQTGWVMLVSNVAMGAQEDTVYRTVDGGARWTPVSSTTWSTHGSGAIAPGGAKTGLAFSSPLRGWATISNDRWQGHVQVDVTEDGGATWQGQSLPVPTPLAAFTSTTLPPTFLSPKDGVLPVLFESSDGMSHDLCLYRTADGGATWIPGTPLAVAPAQDFPMGDAAAILATAPPDDAWAWDGAHLQATADDGVTWHALPATGLPPGVVQIEFLSPTDGYALLSGAPQGELLRTTDGGSTWLPAS